MFLIGGTAALTMEGGTRVTDSIAQALAQWQAEYPGEWWPWGVQSIDFNGDGLDDLCITQHNGGSRILENLGDGQWQWANVGSNLGGTYRPVAWDFSGDGQADLLFRDSLPNTAYRNTGGAFASVGFGYGTTNDPIRQLGPGWFGHDWGRWEWDGATFQPQSWVNPNHGKLPQAIKTKIDESLGKQFFRAWFSEVGNVVTVSGFWSYHKAPLFCCVLRGSTKRLVDVSALWGVPDDGAVVYHSADFICIVGHGVYQWKNGRYEKMPGELTNFLADRADWPHEVTPYDAGYVVSNVRGRIVKLCDPQWHVLETIVSWDGECVAVGDFNGDGRDDVAVGTGETVTIRWGQ